MKEFIPGETLILMNPLAIDNRYFDDQDYIDLPKGAIRSEVTFVDDSFIRELCWIKTSKMKYHIRVKRKWLARPPEFKKWLARPPEFKKWLARPPEFKKWKHGECVLKVDVQELPEELFDYLDMSNTTFTCESDLIFHSEEMFNSMIPS